LLEHKAHHLENVIKEDEALDATRRHNEELESQASVAEQVERQD